MSRPGRKPPSAEAFYSDSSEDVDGKYATPPEVWRIVARPFGGIFDLDAAAGCEPHPIARVRYTEEDDGTEMPWFGDVWCNHPYGRGINRKWADTILGEIQRSGVDSVHVLTRNSTGTIWCQRLLRAADLVTLIGWPDESGRLYFIDTDPETETSEHNASFGVMLLSFLGPGRDEFPEGYEDALTQLGLVLEPRCSEDGSIL